MTKKTFCIILILTILATMCVLCACHEHEFGEWKTTVEPTCTQNGEKQRLCDCGEQQTEAIPATGHTPGDWTFVDAPTCTEGGNKQQKCTGCGKVLDEQTVGALGHSPITHQAQAPTCTEIGWAEYVTCENCDYSTYEEIPATDHDFTQAPTYVWSNDYSACSATIQCANGCGESLVKHATVTSNTVASTCQVAGSTTYTATFDADGYTTQTHVVKLALGDHFYDGQTCEVCGAKDPTGLMYSLSSDGEYYYVSGFHSADIPAQLVIPSTYNGKPVTFIGQNALRECDTITSVAISEGITAINAGAFSGCDNLATITIPSSVAEIIQRDTFFSKSLTNINVDEGNTHYKSVDGVLYTKDGSTLVAYPMAKTATAYVVPDGVTTIAYSAFGNCVYLTNVTLPSSLTSIVTCAFEGCTNLVSITLPNGLTEMGVNAFSGCSTLASITIPNSVTSIGANTFKECAQLKSVVFQQNSSCTSIGESAFYNCSILESITIPSSVKTIGANAFFQCSNLQSVTFEDNSQLTTIGDYAFYFCNKLPSITLPDSVTTIDSYAFAACHMLSTITIPSRVTTIADSLFENCIGLQSIVIPTSVTKIGNASFKNCQKLKNVYYCGTQSQWEDIYKGTSNTYLNMATVTYNYTAE